MRNFKEGNYIQCVAFDPTGNYIGKKNFFYDAIFPLDMLYIIHRGWVYQWSSGCTGFTNTRRCLPAISLLKRCRDQDHILP